MMEQYLDAAPYLPQQSPMRLIERIVAVTAETAHCQSKVSSTSLLAPFIDEHGLPNWFALELMAQTIGVWNGYHNRDKNRAPKMGMLLGGRAIHMTQHYFPIDALLDIQVTKIMQDDKLGSFEGVISIENHAIAKGRINVYQPDDEEIGKIIQGVF